jgi:putative lipoic acid-binding regulatory protein
MDKKELIQFPCDFTIKIMGLNTDEFVAEIADIIAQHSQVFNREIHITTKQSSNGKYLSISAVIQAQSQQHLDKIYISINKHKLVKFVL